MSGRRSRFPPLVGLAPLVVLLVVWQIVATGPQPSFPPPSSWATALASLATSGQLAEAIVDTLWTFAAGLALASVVGFVLGMAIGTLPRFRRWSAFLLEYLRALPPPVVVPIAVLFVGYSDPMKVGVIAFTALWPILLNVVAGVSRTQAALADVGRTLRLSRAEVLTKLYAPAVTPDFLLGVRVAAPLAIVIALLVEMITALPGIGALMVAGQRNFNSAQVFGLLVVVGLVGLVVNLAVGALENRVLRRWPPAGHGER